MYTRFIELKFFCDWGKVYVLLSIVVNIISNICMCYASLLDDCELLLLE